MDAVLVVEVDGQMIVRRELRVEPENPYTVIAEYDGLVPSEATARLEPPDAFMTDNKAIVIFNTRRILRVELVTDGNYFLERLLYVHPNLDLEVRTDHDATGSYDIVIFDRTVPPPLSGGSYLLIGTVSAFFPTQAVGIIENPAVTGWDHRHPVLQGVDPSSLTIYRALDLPRGTDFESIVHAGGSTLIYSYVTPENARFLGITFDVTETDLPLRADFPILIANMLTWLNPAPDESGSEQIKTGDMFETTTSSGLGDPTIERPDKTIETVPAIDGSLRYRGTDLAGIYTITQGDSVRLFAANLENAAESDIRDRQELVLTAGNVRPEERLDAGRTGRPLWALAIILALLVLLVEWGYWLRRELT